MNKISPRTKGGAAEHKLISEPVGFMLALLFAALTVYVSSLAYYSFISADDYYTGTITVTGHGEVEVKPDLQKLTVDISSSVAIPNGTSTTPKVATSTADSYKKVILYLKLKGVADSDIKILSAKSIVVKLRGANMTNAKSIASDVERISPKLITATLQDPEVENLDQIRARALDIALINAKVNAVKVSRSLGADLGKVISFYDNNNSGGSYEGDYADENYDPNTIVSDISVSFQTR